MFGGLFTLIVLAGLAYIVSRGATRELRERVTRAEAQITHLERQVFDLTTRRRGDGEAPPDSARQSPQAPGLPPAPAAATGVPKPILPPPRDEQPPATPPLSQGGGTPRPLPPPAQPAASAPPQASLEERLGAHWAVYAGGLALAIGGLFLVRYSIEAGLLGPGVRVVLGALLAAALVAGGEYIRRSDATLPIDLLPKAHIPSVLTAAGTMVAFATVYAAHALYGFIGPALAFVLLGAVGIATMLAAALHGPALAGLGLAGSYATPLLVASETPSPWPVVIFLAVVAAAAHLLARSRHWLWLAATAVAGAMAWGFALADMIGVSGDAANSTWIAATMTHALIQTGLISAFLGIEPHAGTPDGEAQLDPVASLALVAATVVIAVVLAATPFKHALWLPFAVVAIALLALTGRASAPAAAAAVLAGLVGLAVALLWPGLQAPADHSLMMPEAARLLRLPEQIAMYLAGTAALTLGAAAVALGRLISSPALPVRTAGLYAVAATVPPLLALVVAYLRVTQFDTSLSFAAGGIGLAAIFAIQAGRFQGGGDRTHTGAWPLATGAFAAGTIAALSFALVASLSRGYLTVAFALAALGTAYVASLKAIPLLRPVVTVLGAVVLARVAWDPRIAGASLGTLPVFNWLLLGYGVPAVSFAAAATLLRPQGEDWPVRLCDGLAVLFAGLLAVFEIHHFMTGGDLTRPIAGHVEQGLQAVTALLFTHVLGRLDLKRANPVFHYASLAFAAISGVFIVFGLGLFENPALTDAPVTGRPVFSSLIPGYLLPGIVTLFVARQSRGVRPDWFVTAASVLGLALIFAYVTLEVRHVFHGARIGFWHHTSGPEQWAYTAAWLALGVAALGYGLIRGSLEARIASAVLIVLACLKVVLVDLAGVSGLWRALSFLCLGAVLIGIGLVYQKIVFARPAPK